MPSARLPSVPDFNAVERAAPDFAERQQYVLMLIGNLGLNWSNNESMFIYVLMVLLEIQEVEAAIIFSTLNTTRARLDVVRRLATVKIRDEAVAATLKRLIKRFEAGTRLRNEFNHCMYKLNAQGEITHTHLMRPHEDKGVLTLGALREMNDERIREIIEANRQLKRLNRDLWTFLPQLRASVAGATIRRPDGADDAALAV
ncbi:hypothetical protein G3T14_15215 [Methylobacterium sp. BTF04]|uniref:hypothetical protein n=1 Tax=Methylobacterium sp. BTF04 TaxID=2708300 RepID=UPI0013D17BF5|nr:hypothetical protein [Methylobacterium sp. BTF04]NEU13471.1 hypothetical protein [Methylobacterium sp. BTF04]